MRFVQVKTKRSQLEKFVLSWCLENYVFIHKYQNASLPANVFPVFYEELVMNPENTIRDICKKVKMAYNENMLSMVKVPSRGIVHSAEETGDQIIAGNTDYLTNRWKESLDVNTEKQVKDILLSFGISIY